jgi:hypothetical protein
MIVQTKLMAMTPKEKLHHYFLNWLGSFVDLADAAVGILTFGVVTPVWSMNFVSWRIISGGKKAKAKRLREKKLCKSETSKY